MKLPVLPCACKRPYTGIPAPTAAPTVRLKIAAVFVSEAPAGVIPGNAYTCTHTTTTLIGFYWNGVFQRPGIDYTRSGAVLTFTASATASGDNVFVVYLK